MSTRRSATSLHLNRRRRGEAPSRPVARPAGGPVTATRRRRVDTPQDRALYSCSCGFVFEAAVSTSVDCPHCGDAQAW